MQGPEPKISIAFATNTGTGRLGVATVLAHARENLPVRATMVQVMPTDSDAVKVSTDARLRSRHLIVPPTSGAYRYRAAVKDAQGSWSEWSDPVTFAASTFARGDDEVSIGVGVRRESELEEPAVLFPDLSQGSGEVLVTRTLVNAGFYDEQRRTKWNDPRTAFNVLLRDVDPTQVALLHRFYQSLNGPLTPFLFDWTDPVTGRSTRHAVRFQDPVLNERLVVVDRSDLDFTLIETSSRPTGGDI